MFTEAQGVAKELQFAVQHIKAFETLSEATDAAKLGGQTGGAAAASGSIGGGERQPSEKGKESKGGGDGAGILLTTLEGVTMVLEASEAGYMVADVALPTDAGTAGRSTAQHLNLPPQPAPNTIFESLESLLDAHSPLYRDAFAGALFAKLDGLAGAAAGSDDDASSIAGGGGAVVAHPTTTASTGAAAAAAAAARTVGGEWWGANVIPAANRGAGNQHAETETGPDPEKIAPKAATKIQISALPSPPTPLPLPPPPPPFVAWNRGDVPMIITIPHGGELMPAHLADRTSGCLYGDDRTMEFGAALVAGLAEGLGGKSPFVVRCGLHRIKLDANRRVRLLPSTNTCVEHPPSPLPSDCGDICCTKFNTTRLHTRISCAYRFS